MPPHSPPPTGRPLAITCPQCHRAECVLVGTVVKCMAKFVSVRSVTWGEAKVGLAAQGGGGQVVETEQLEEKCGWEQDIK